VPGKDSLSTQELETLSGYFQVLSLPSRLDLLRILQVPRTAQEIRLAPARRDAVGQRDRAVSRQALTGHLRRLQEIGLVEGIPGKRHGREVTEFRVDQARFFSLVEELRRVSLIPAPLEGVTALQDGAAGLNGLPDEGPALVMANGPLEGRGFQLDGTGPWLIGRSMQSHFRVAHDPFVSKRNSVVRKRLAGGRDGWSIEAQRESRNGTWLNWRRMAPGEEAPLRNGDVLRVGRTLLVMRGA